MKIHNVRLGYAHNSSSTHSIVFLPGPDAEEVEDHGALEFGWDFFTAGSPEKKMRYLASMLAPAFGAERAKDMTGLSHMTRPDWLPDDDTNEGLVSYIDHQSVINFPMSHDGETPHEDFARALVGVMQRADVAILGGNDNTNEEHRLRKVDGVRDVPGFRPLVRDAGPKDAGRIRKDGDYWTYFREAGRGSHKVRFSVEDADIAVTKASAPELVDVKITDFCPFDCSYCYMGSTTKGNHASMEDLEKIADALQALEVFEVALGGGEPTMHPHFVDILKMFRSRNIIPNFTTRNKALLQENQTRTVVDELCGSFAFSVDSAKVLESILPQRPKETYPEAPPFPQRPDGDLGDYYSAASQAWNAALRKHWASPEYKAHKEGRDQYEGSAEYKEWKRQKALNPPNVQVVMGTISNEDFTSIVKQCRDQGIDLTLLGYKTTGRGSAFETKPSAGWVDEYRRLKKAGQAPYRLGIDTVLAAQVQDRLEDLGIPQESYETEEGKFSMYIDAVEKKMGKCSYVTDDEYVPMTIDDGLPSHIKETFAQW